MKNLTVLNKKNISDNVLSFLFLMNRINYKKLKSIAKRPLLPHYVFYKFFLKSIQYEFFFCWNKKFTQSNFNLKAFLPGALLHKRMFFKNIKFFNFVTNNPKNSYIWYNFAFKSFFYKSLYFNKINQYPSIGGNTVLISHINNSFNETLLVDNLYFKNFFKTFDLNDVKINFFICFNVGLLQIKEYYQICILLWFMKVFNKINKNFFKKV